MPDWALTSSQKLVNTSISLGPSKLVKLNHSPLPPVSPGLMVPDAGSSVGVPPLVPVPWAVAKPVS